MLFGGQFSLNLEAANIPLSQQMKAVARLEGIIARAFCALLMIYLIYEANLF